MSFSCKMLLTRSGFCIFKNAESSFPIISKTVFLQNPHDHPFMKMWQYDVNFNISPCTQHSRPSGTTALKLTGCCPNYWQQMGSTGVKCPIFKFFINISILCEDTRKQMCGFMQYKSPLLHANTISRSLFWGGEIFPRLKGSLASIFTYVSG